jgi:hypothetical protein
MERMIIEIDILGAFGALCKDIIRDTPEMEDKYVEA